MRIRRLELIGFKSFPFSTTIDFPEGITAIVGPNGCGKSNILDALMWVMGATSPKLLRSRSMEDVIFSGTEEVAPLGRAEVRLFIDNSNRLACEPYRELPEIEIRRVVYRTGESEFWLNGHRCRLRDITEFFLGTGLGTNSYAIIEQGKVDHVINDKPEERRLLLDESAGISKYKERREISLRKMEATKQNLSRVEDILYEVSRQANRLKRQAAKARRYQRLKGRLDKLLIHKSTLRLMALRENQEKMKTALETLVRQAEAKQSELNAMEVKVAAVQTHFLEREEALRNLNEAYAQSRDALSEGRQSLFSLQERQGRLEETLKGISETYEEAEQRRETLQSQVIGLKDEIKTLENEIAEKEHRLKKKISDFQSEKDRLSNMEALFEAHKHAVFETMSAEVDAKNRVIQLSERIEVTNRGIKNREGELREALKRLKTLKETVSSHEASIRDLEENLGDIQREKQQLEEELSKAAGEEGKLKDSLREMERRLAEDRSSLSSLLEIQKRMEDISSKGAKVLIGQFFTHKGGGSSNSRLVADTIEIDPRYDRALEAILRDELEFVLVDDHKTALKSLSFLKEKNAGRSGLIPRDRIASCGESGVQEGHPDLVPLVNFVHGPEEERDVLKCLLKDIWVVEEQSKAVEIHKRNGFSGVLVTIDGDVFYPNGVIVGGSYEGGTGGRVALNRKIAGLKKRISSLEAEKKALVSKANIAGRRSTQLRTRLEGVTKGLRNVEMDLLTHRRDIESASKDCTWVERQIEVLKAEIEEMRQLVETVRVKHSSSQLDLEKCREKLEALNAKSGKYENDIQAMKEVVERQNLEVNILRIEEAKTREKFQGRLQKLATLKEDLKRLNGEIIHKRQRHAELSEKLEGISRQAVSLRGEIRKNEAVLEKLKGEIDAGELNLRREKESIRELEEKKNLLFREFQELKERVSERKLEISQKEMEIDNLMKEVKVRFNVDLGASGLQEIDTGEVEKIDEAEIADLEKKLAGIGEINFVAAKEFEELKKRMTFLKKQRADILEAIQTLSETIQRINRTTTARFKETFTKTQENFSGLFTKLFGGGKAEIRLTDTSNYRETGVEIFAQPPGKRLQAIRLLSGGEKALVAIAFLFALFLVRPSPFCVLDEVDAPLDESNIDRFNKLLVELSGLSQFIIITHNKNTMACAQSLLGVTMEQPGISKIVSVSLGEVPN